VHSDEEDRCFGEVVGDGTVYVYILLFCLLLWWWLLSRHPESFFISSDAATK
jgi:hypothetical protein